MTDSATFGWLGVTALLVAVGWLLAFSYGPWLGGLLLLAFAVLMFIKAFMKETKESVLEETP